jgi:predicted amidophosphoribosyltransferase
VGKVRSLPVVQDLLTRTQNMASQVSLANREERARNAQGSFACQGSVSGESVLLVDDVSTMGSTLGACAQILKERGASSVWGLVLAGEA